MCSSVVQLHGSGSGRIHPAHPSALNFQFALWLIRRTLLGTPTES
jgi:hypothetical protein